MMQAIGRRYDGSFLACYRYIELHPVRALMVEDPAGYASTSYHANASGQPSPLVTPHETYQALGEDNDARRVAYRAWVTGTIDETEWAEPASARTWTATAKTEVCLAAKGPLPPP